MSRIATISTYALFLARFVAFFLVMAPCETMIAQKASIPQTGCSPLEKDRPLLFISFDKPDQKAWSGNGYVKGVLLRFRNNSDCAVVFEAAPDQAQTFRMKNGKSIRLQMSEAGDG